MDLGWVQFDWVDILTVGFLWGWTLKSKLGLIYGGGWVEPPQLVEFWHLFTCSMQLSKLKSRD